MSPEFSPLDATLGGALIGTAASAMLLLEGRVTGISGIIGDGVDNDGDTLIDEPGELTGYAATMTPGLSIDLASALTVPQNGTPWALALSGVATPFTYTPVAGDDLADVAAGFAALLSASGTGFKASAEGNRLLILKPGATAAEDVVIDKVRYEGVLPWPKRSSPYPCSPSGTHPVQPLTSPAVAGVPPPHSAPWPPAAPAPGPSAGRRAGAGRTGPG